jgi:SAM-dependent methyltransferase
MKSAVAWSRAAEPPVGRLGRGGLDRLLALAYGLTYDAIMRRFPPYQALLDEVSALVARSVPPGIPRRQARVLDVSCGTGTVALRLADEGYRVVALDAVEPLVRAARRRSGRRTSASFHHLDIARDQPPGAGSFDVIVSMHTLYWHPDPAGVLAACRRLMAPGGRGIFLTYGRPARIGRTFGEIRRGQGLRAAGGALRWLVPTGIFEALRRHELQYLTRTEFDRALARAGFEVLESRETFLAGLSLLAWTRPQLAGAPP